MIGSQKRVKSGVNMSSKRESSAFMIAFTVFLKIKFYGSVRTYFEVINNFKIPTTKNWLHVREIPIVRPKTLSFPPKNLDHVRVTGI
jgi:hypothetical protein